ncbi:hypothetical protein KR093_000343, partial [Drosophila rubida]
NTMTMPKATTTTTRTMKTATRRGTFSTATSVLLLCAALLLTQSLGILALSGDGNAAVEQLPGQADAWSEGSGWELTTAKEELTTAGNEDIETNETTAAPSEPEQESTASPEQETTANPNEPEQETTVSPNEPEQETTVNPNEPEQETTTVNPNEPEQETTASSSEPEQETSAKPTEQPASSEAPTTTTEADVITTIAPTPPAPPVFECQAAGVYPHNSGDCQRFHNCLLDAQTGELLAFDMACPPLTAFSPLDGVCLRDVSSCQDDGFACLAPGRFAGSDDSFYYSCVPRLAGVGYRKYIVRCSPGTRFEPLVNRCWRYDWTQFVPGVPSLESSDLTAIKREQKQLKAQEKLRLKAEKNKEKEARKQAKLDEKLAKKAAKEQAKKDAKANKPLSVESVESVEQAS